MMLIACLLSAMGGAVLGVATMCLITVAKEADDQLTNAASRANLSARQLAEAIKAREEAERAREAAEKDLAGRRRSSEGRESHDE